MKASLLSFLLIFTLVFLSSCGGREEGSEDSASSTPSNPTTPTTKVSTDWLLDQSSGMVKLISPADDAASFFGDAVAIGDFNGDGKKDVAIGAPRGDYSVSGSTGQADSGGVFIFNSVEDQTSLTVADLMVTSNSNTNNWFGTSLYTHDVNADGIDDLIVGAPKEDRVGANSGSVYIYYGSSNGLNTTASQIIDHPNSTGNEGFGSQIRVADLDGDNYSELIISAQYTDTPVTNAGAFWVIPGTANELYSTAAAVQVTMPVALVSVSDECGRGLAVGDYDGDNVLDIYLGCPYDDTGAGNSGAVYVYLGTGVNGGWVVNNALPDVTIVNPVPLANDYFGESIVSIDYDDDFKTDLIVGAVRGDEISYDSGSLYLFNDIQGSAAVDTIVGPPFTSISIEYFGASFAKGDVNGDGKEDLLVGSHYGRFKGYASGRVTALLAGLWGGIDFSSSAKNFQYDYHKKPVQKKLNHNSYFGSAVCHGDMNGDGLEDLIVGAYNDDSRYTNDGSIYIYHQQTDGKIYQEPNVKLRLGGLISGTRGFGSSCLVFDYNRDGYNDLLVGAIYDDTVGANSGHVYIFAGTSTGINLTSSKAISGPATTNYGFGSSMAIGDVDNDGYDDLLVGASLDDLTNADQGAIYIFRSDSTTGIVDLNNSSRFENVGGVASDNFGLSMVVFDYDQDGDNDLLVGAPGDDTTNANTGIVNIFLNGTNGTTSGTNTLLDQTIDSNITAPTSMANIAFGSGLHSDTYFDTTYPDLFVGSYLDDIAGGDAGNVWIYKGKSTGVESMAITTGTFDPPAYDNAEWFGYAVTTFDFNGDGIKDLFVSSPTDDEIGLNAGSVYIKLEKLP